MCIPCVLPANDITVAGFLVTVEFVELYCINYSMCRI